MRDLIVGRNDGTIEVYSYEVSQLYLKNNCPAHGNRNVGWSVNQFLKSSIS